MPHPMHSLEEDKRFYQAIIDNKRWDYFHNSYLLWEDISKCNLPEDFIIEFKDEINWNSIFNFSDVSITFLFKYQHKIDFSRMGGCKYFREDFINKFRKLIDWEDFGTSFIVDNSIILKYHYKIKNSNNVMHMILMDWRRDNISC